MNVTNGQIQDMYTLIKELRDIVERLGEGKDTEILLDAYSLRLNRLCVFSAEVQRRYNSLTNRGYVSDQILVLR